jgi:hypothetical protein
MEAFQFYIQLKKQKSRLGGDDCLVAFGKKFPGEKVNVRQCVVVMQQPVLSSPESLCIFTQSP